MRQEPILDKRHLRTDSRGITRNHQLTRQLNLLNIDILDHGYFVGNQQWNQFNVVSPFTRLYYMIDDTGWLETENGRIDLVPGNMYLIPSNTRVNLRTDQRIEKFYFHVSVRFADMDILDGIGQCFSMAIPEKLLSQLLDAYTHGGLIGLITFKHVAYWTLDLFLRDQLPDLSGRLDLASRYRSLYSFVENNLSASLTPPSVCTAIGLSYETARRQFRSDNGITLHQFIHGRLIQKAALMLLMTDSTIQQIASQLGFHDEFYFSRFFKQKMEYSPREYRRINALLRL